ncbi:MAG: MoxR family ATPase [Firmicutes bacterium]|jgi:MoxR-like ATPase|uniref:ATPase n=1 Tax=Sulfobacillus benefaciens TaxID=453960 RepID=A0A2T2X0L7_9FIRM|nr:MoxR family ATPase [Bacillota bacterium]MCL5014941.1 MoxR family ATPase [Bacillota bacterium]PSR28025.1 MAG: ATPase [Sulfobacillus benefaciens]HBQ95355.1 ATPase [Sulfobacillus sp.]
MANLDRIEDVMQQLSHQQYLADRSLATAIFLCLKLERPLFLEGEPGVGKTAVAQAMAQVLNVPLIRLQCYEGIDRESALYEWNYPKQLLAIRLHESSAQGGLTLGQDSLYQTEFLLKRPLFEALAPEGPAPVLLIDEIDRSDDEFEAFLLEILSEFQISIPELGTIKAKEKPFIVLTSNRTRDIHDALKRRCIYHWLDYPSFERELEIVELKVPGLDGKLRRDIVRFIQRFRREGFDKRPGIAETLDWANALEALVTRSLSPEVITDTLGVLLKDREDLKLVQEEELIERILKELEADDTSLW